MKRGHSNGSHTPSLFLLSISIYTLVFSPLISAWAQEIDIVAPAIKYRPASAPAVPGRPYEIVSIITDNTGVKNAALFYRPAGKEGYLSLTMQDKPNSTYSAVIPEDLVLEPKIDFYIQAVDISGNTSFQGSPASPLQITVIPQSQAETQPIAPPSKASPPLATLPLAPEFGSAPMPPAAPSPSVGISSSVSSSASAKPEPGPVSGALKSGAVTAAQPIYTRGWFWLLVVGIAGGAAAWVEENKDSASSPTGNVVFVMPLP